MDRNRRRRSICSRRTGKRSDRWRISNGSRGVLHVDGYAGFERLTGNGDIVLAACWAHTRRKFYEVAEATGSLVAAETLRRIGELYAVEARVRGQSSAHRLAERRSFSRPIATTATRTQMICNNVLVENILLKSVMMPPSSAGDRAGFQA
ncbi:transposase [Bradyrhizobium sp. SSUT18]|nr:transposase [Bradyrhizobium sp. SSUT18]MDH2405061.1 transposase [Bradyrhizobium sp. SSUT18]